MRNANLVLMFLLELTVYVSVAIWAVTIGSGTALHVVYAIIAVGIFAGVWALIGAPNARYPVHGPGRVALEILWFGGGIVAMAAVGDVVPAIVFGALFLLNAVGRIILGGTEKSS